jgi:hypothetical protein
VLLGHPHVDGNHRLQERRLALQICGSGCHRWPRDEHGCLLGADPMSCVCVLARTTCRRRHPPGLAGRFPRRRLSRPNHRPFRDGRSPSDRSRPVGIAAAGRARVRRRHGRAASGHGDRATRLPSAADDGRSMTSHRIVALPAFLGTDYLLQRTATNPRQGQAGVDSRI